MISGICTYVFGGVLLLESCRKTEAVSTIPINFAVPGGFPQPVYNFQSNPLTEEGFALGKKLFHDGNLSADGHFPCSSCHQQVAAFTTFEHDRSHGYNNSHTLRNAPALMNLAWNKEFFWDGSAATLADVLQKHITDPSEMAESLPNVVNKLESDAVYRDMFRQAFGNEKITADRIYQALSQYVLQLVSANSKYDKVKNGTATFSTQEASGYAVFQQKCAACHKEPLFTDYSYRNVGLPIDPLLKDFGRMRVTGKKEDSLKFRVPSLRNVDVTSYYTHDGRLSMMRMMIQHYRNSVVPGPTLDPLLQNGLQLTNQQEDDLVAFLRTLTDTSFINNSRFKE